MTKTLITAIFLSQALIGGAHAAFINDTQLVSNRIQLADNNPFSGARSFSIILERDTFATPKAPVPYYQYWDCEWRQTAQQCVAIYSLLQQELEK